MPINNPTYDATMVFCDIVRFSLYSDSEQLDLINSLNGEVTRILFPYLSSFGSQPSIICQPTGDGMVVILVNNRDAQLVFALIKCLIDWTKDVLKKLRIEKPDHCHIRVGLHVGKVSLVTDINRLPNACGDEINKCRRIMDQARPNQVLLSKEAYDAFIGTDDGCYSCYPFSATKPAEFSPQAKTITVKHQKTVKVHTMNRKNDAAWTVGDPYSVPTVVDGPDGAIERTNQITELLTTLAEGRIDFFEVFEQASFSSFAISEHMDEGYTRELANVRWTPILGRRLGLFKVGLGWRPARPIPKVSHGR